METLARNEFSVCEKNAEKCHSDNTRWMNLMTAAKEELYFLHKFLNADIFEPAQPNLYEKLQFFLQRVEEMRDKLNIAVHEHQKEVDTILKEGEDSNNLCGSEHNKLHDQLKFLLSEWSDLKLKIYQTTGDLLRKRN